MYSTFLARAAANRRRLRLRAGLNARAANRTFLDRFTQPIRTADSATISLGSLIKDSIGAHIAHVHGIVRALKPVTSMRSCSTDEQTWVPLCSTAIDCFYLVVRLCCATRIPNYPRRRQRWFCRCRWASALSAPPLVAPIVSWLGIVHSARTLPERSSSITRHRLTSTAQTRFETPIQSIRRTRTESTGAYKGTIALRYRSQQYTRTKRNRNLRRDSRPYRNVETRHYARSTRPALNHSTFAVDVQYRSMLLRRNRKRCAVER